MIQSKIYFTSPWLYVVNRYFGFIFRLVETLAIEKETVTDIKVFDNLTQTGTNDCRNRTCPGLLLITPEGCVCACGNGMTLNASGTLCLPKLNHTIITQSECPPGNIYILSRSKSSKSLFTFPILISRKPSMQIECK